MSLPNPPATYDQNDQARLRDELRKDDAQSLKRGRDIELGQSRVILTDTVTGSRYALKVASGVLSIVAV